MSQPIVFVSYSHDSPEHRNTVLQLAERLRDDGFETRLDQYVNGTPVERWPQWMLNQVEEAAFVLCICTKTYYRRFRGQESKGRGRGVSWEGAIITQALYDDPALTKKFVPVLLDAEHASFIPEPIRGVTFYTLDDDTNYKALCDYLDGVAGVEPRPIGKRPPKQRRRVGEVGTIVPQKQKRPEKPFHLPFVSLESLFQGRDKELLALHERLRGGSAAVTARHAVQGLGGVGKTRLAVEYAWKYAGDYSVVLFIVARSRVRQNAGDVAESETPLAALPRSGERGYGESLDAALAGLAKTLDLPERDLPDQAKQVAAVLRWFASHRGWLLIVDNVDDDESAQQLQHLLPQLRTGTLLITTRRRNWSAAIKTLPLDSLDIDAATQFLLDRTAGHRTETPDDATAARHLAEDLGGLPLALEQAGAHVQVHGGMLADYRRRWQQNEQQLRDWCDEQLMQYDRSVAATWLTSFERLDVPAQALLQLLAWLSPEPFPLLVYRPAAGAGSEEPEGESESSRPGAGASGWAVNEERALAQLVAHSLVQRDGGMLTVHRLVQAITRDRLPNEERLASLDRALAFVNDLASEESQDVRTWDLWTPLRPHVTTLVQHALAAERHQPTTRLMNELALYLEARCVFPEAEALHRRALEIDERSFGKEHPDVAIRLNNLAALLSGTNRLAEAEPLMRRALEIDERSFGKEHPNVAIRLNNLAHLLRATNRLAEAEPMMRRALEIDERSLGKEHPNVAIRLNNLATLLSSTNRLAVAEPLMRRALEIDERSFGKEHPNVARDLNNLAQLLLATNQQAVAEPLMRRALEIWERSLGEEHPQVATALNNLAQFLKATNRLAEAKPLVRKCCKISRRFWEATGYEHPHAETFLGNYRGLLSAMGVSESDIAAQMAEVTGIEAET